MNKTKEDDRIQLWVRFHAQGWALETDKKILGWFPTEDGAINAGLAMIEDWPEHYQICVENGPKEIVPHPPVLENPIAWTVPYELIIGIAFLGIGAAVLFLALAINF